MSNIRLDKNIIITGDDSVRKEELINDYKILAKNNNYEILTVDIEKLTGRGIPEILYTVPMFSVGKLIILKAGKLKETEIEQIIDAIGRADSRTMIIFVVGSISIKSSDEIKRNNIEIIELKSLKYSALQKYIKDKYKNVIKLFGDSIVNSLFDIYGNDLPMIDSEMRKLSLIAEEKDCSRNDLEMLIPQINIETAIYRAMDEILDGKKENALRYFSALKEQSVDINQILALFQNLFIRLMLIKISNAWDEKHASKITGLPQFISRKYIKYSQHITYQKLKYIINKLTGIDYLIKEGKVIGFQNLLQIVMNMV
jgi:DNA polymerase III delta subunit